jgi:hypothetical protein
MRLISFKFKRVAEQKITTLNYKLIDANNAHSGNILSNIVRKNIMSHVNMYDGHELAVYQSIKTIHSDRKYS